MKQKILKDKSFVLGIFLIGIFVFLALFADMLKIYDPLAVHPEMKLSPMSKEHIFGCDNLGRDFFSRIVYGSRVTLVCAVIIMAINLTISVVIGIAAGYYGGVVDLVLSRIIDTILAFPSLIISLYILAKFGCGLSNLIFSLTIVGWARYARIIRGLAMSIKEKNYIKSARLGGSSHRRIILSHVLGNSVSPIIVLAALDMGHTIFSISGLSFLGLGINPPTPEWGVIINESKPFIESYPHLLLIPSVCIFSLVTGFNLVGRAIEKMISEGGGV